MARQSFLMPKIQSSGELSQVIFINAFTGWNSIGHRRTLQPKGNRKTRVSRYCICHVGHHAVCAFLLLLYKGRQMGRPVITSLRGHRAVKILITWTIRWEQRVVGPSLSAGSIESGATESRRQKQQKQIKIKVTCVIPSVEWLGWLRLKRRSLLKWWSESWVCRWDLFCQRSKMSGRWPWNYAAARRWWPRLHRPKENVCCLFYFIFYFIEFNLIDSFSFSSVLF